MIFIKMLDDAPPHSFFLIQEVNDEKHNTPHAQRPRSLTTYKVQVDDKYPVLWTVAISAS